MPLCSVWRSFPVLPSPTRQQRKCPLRRTLKRSAERSSLMATKLRMRKKNWRAPRFLEHETESRVPGRHAPTQPCKHKMSFRMTTRMKLLTHWPSLLLYLTQEHECASAIGPPIGSQVSRIRYFIFAKDRKQLLGRFEWSGHLRLFQGTKKYDSSYKNLGGEAVVLCRGRLRLY